MKGRMIICCMLFSLNAAAQESATLLNADTTESKKSSWIPPVLVEKFNMVTHHLDSAARKKVDSRFIEVPSKPWRIILQYKENAIEVEDDNNIIDPSTMEHMQWQMDFHPPMAASLGVWLGYHGTGVALSLPLQKNAGRYFSFGSTGAKYGFNFRLRRFSIYDTDFSYKIFDADGKVIEEEAYPAQTYNPVWIRSIYLNGYYVFNGRRYSQAAAYNQSVIQRRSAGSFLAGVTYYQSSLDYSGQENSLLMLFSNNTGKIQLQQANIGIGYGFNFVPFKGLIINAMVMPSVSIYNRVKVVKYDSNYEVFSEVGENEIDDYGEWNPETRTWANGKTHRPLEIVSDDEVIDDAESWRSGSEITHGKMRFNFDLRLGIVYNWRNFFIGAQLLFNQFDYKKDMNKVNILDGFFRASLGIRL